MITVLFCRSATSPPHIPATKSYPYLPILTTHSLLPASSCHHGIIVVDQIIAHHKVVPDYESQTVLYYS